MLQDRIQNTVQNTVDNTAGLGIFKLVCEKKRMKWLNHADYNFFILIQIHFNLDHAEKAYVMKLQSRGLMS